MITSSQFAEMAERLSARRRRQNREPAAQEQAEADLHRDFIQWLNLNEVERIHQWMTRKSQLEPGWPDFTLLKNGRACCVEFKVAPNKLSADQKQVIDRLHERAIETAVAYTLAEAISHCREHLKLW